MQDVHQARTWRLARKKAAFKKSLFSYIIINIFLWAIWWFSTGRSNGLATFPWPLWVMLGWGLGIGFQYFDAYCHNAKSLTDKEYDRLKHQQEHT